MRGRFVYIKSLVFCGRPMVAPTSLKGYVCGKQYCNRKFYTGSLIPSLRANAQCHPSLRKGLKVSFTSMDDLIRLGSKVKEYLLFTDRLDTCLAAARSRSRSDITP